MYYYALGCRPDAAIGELFVELSDTYPQLYVSLILGMAKFGNHGDAHDKYIEARNKNILCE